MPFPWQTLVLLLVLLLAWVAWWLLGVNWVKAWNWLAQGAWVAVLLLVVLAALVWSQVAPHDLDIGFTRVPNFWWQVGGAALLAGLALFCGWVQGVMGWTPQEYPIYPAENHSDLSHGHEHPVGMAHGHEAAHADEPQENGHGGHH